MNKAIGGYFELELNDFGSIFHDDAVALNTGRNALEYILIQRKYKRLYIPYYTCDVILQPLIRQGVEYVFYHIDDSFIPIDIAPKNDEAILFVNYYGIMSRQVKYLSEIYTNLIIDNSQAFYEKPIQDIDTFYSPRKFFGLPDGGFAYCKSNTPLKLDRDSSSCSMSHLLTRIENGAEAGYTQFKANDKNLDDRPLMCMSQVTEKLMRNISFESIRHKRRANFKDMHACLYEENELTPLIDRSIYEAPMIYPFLKKNNLKKRKNLIGNKIYTATYWPNVKTWLKTSIYLETYLVDNLIALPIDQRYDRTEIQFILKSICREL
jgi:hypothetical protein